MVKAKAYELSIEPAHTDNEKIYMSKGHHSIEDFIEELREYGVDPEDYSVPTHRYVKTVPAPKNSWYHYFYHFVDKTTRGACPATCVREYGEVMYKDWVKK